MDKNHLLLLGDTGTGKTGSLISLIHAGYTLRLLDLENGSKILRNFIKDECPERAGQLIIESMAPKFSIGVGGAKPLKGQHTLTQIGMTLEKWQKEAAPDDVIVVDSLTALGRACLIWAKAQNPGLKDNRAHYMNAQEVVEPFIEVLTHSEFPCHSITITHIDYREVSEDTIRGYASSVGKALGDKIPRHFNEVFRYDKLGSGRQVKHVISTISDAVTNVKNSAPKRLKPSYPISTGLVDIFNTLKG